MMLSLFFMLSLFNLPVDIIYEDGEIILLDDTEYELADFIETDL